MPVPLPDPPGPATDLDRSVLLVDDEADALESLGELVETEGMKALTASNGAEALQMLRSGVRPALVVLDPKMPVLDGWGFCRELDADESLRDIPVAIVSASAAIVALPRVRRYAGFFSKPLDIPRFLATLHRYCS